VAPHFKNLQRSIQYFQGLSLHPPLITVEDQLKKKQQSKEKSDVRSIMWLVDDQKEKWYKSSITEVKNSEIKEEKRWMKNS